VVTFYLSRNTAVYSGGYTLTTYLPKAPPATQSLLSWWFWAAESDLSIPLSAEDAHKIEAKIGRPLELGEAVNLTTGDSIRIENAPKLESV
jgi:hypothetical protein